MRLLLVEDDTFLGQIIEDCLREKCYAIDWLRNGDEVALALRICRYDLAILDLNLPGKNGMHILHEVRSSDHNFPILIISGDNTKDARIRALDTGANDYLVKPFAQDEIEARIRALLRRTYRYVNSIISLGTKKNYMTGMRRWQAMRSTCTFVSFEKNLAGILFIRSVAWDTRFHYPSTDA